MKHLRARRSRAPIRIACLLVAAVAVLSAPSTASAGVSVPVPTGILCSTYNPEAGTVNFRFGYSNIGENGSVSSLFANIAPGDFNFFSPAPPDRGQPAQFVAGNGSFDRTLAAGGPTLTWSLNGVTATADPTAAELPFQRPCPDRGPSIGGLTPGDVAPGTSRQLSVFGQGLLDASLSVSGAGVSVAAPTLATEQRLEVKVTVAADAAPGPRDVLVTAANGDEVGCRGCLVLDTNATGTEGPAGPQGERGPAASASVRHRSGRAVKLNGGKTTTASAKCPQGAAAISGGYQVRGHGSPTSLSVLANHARGTSGWTVTVRARGTRRGQRLLASVTCLAG